MQMIAIVLSFALTVAAVALLVPAVRRMVGVIRSGQPAPGRTGNPGGRAATMLKETFLHTRMLQWHWVGIMHWFVYMAFLRWWMGDGLAFLHVQRAWARAYGNPLIFIWEALTSFPKDSWIPTAPEQLAAAVITGFVLTALLFRRRLWAGGTFSLIALVVPLFAGMASTLRFTAALAPVAILAMKLLAANRIVFAVALLVFLAADYFVTMNWISGALSLV